MSAIFQASITIHRQMKRGNATKRRGRAIKLQAAAKKSACRRITNKSLTRKAFILRPRKPRPPRKTAGQKIKLRRIVDKDKGVGVADAANKIPYLRISVILLRRRNGRLYRNEDGEDGREGEARNGSVG